jgi:ABC-type uncharacterized transport system involved in gliding motility auxiliary subunit
MRAMGFLLASNLFLTACSQVINYTYSKKNFTSPTFETDLSACRHQSPSISAFQATPPDQRAQLDDAMVRDCMKTRGYKIDTEPR